VTIGRRTLAGGQLEVQVRRGRENRTVPLTGAAGAVAELWGGLP
jgi:prolyl-tRNA synthetase